MKFYLTNQISQSLKGFSNIQAELLDGSEIVDDTQSRDLLDQGWLLCETSQTKSRYFVKPRRNSRFVKSWGVMVTDFDVREVKTIANTKGVIVAALGEKIQGMPKLFSRVEILKEFDRLATL